MILSACMPTDLLGILLIVGAAAWGVGWLVYTVIRKKSQEKK